MMLADLGAEVTKVERPGGGDDTRSWGPPYDERGRGDLLPGGQPQQAQRRARPRATPTDLAEARRLALAADVVVENFRPGVMDAARPRLRERSRAENPGLVYCSITGFGGAAPAPRCPATTCSSRRSAG